MASARVFPDFDARLSRFSYLVSLLPATIVDELGLDLELRTRAVRSYTPDGDTGVLVRRSGELGVYDTALTEFAAVVEPTLVEPLPRAADLRGRIDPGLVAGHGRAADRGADRGELF